MKHMPGCRICTAEFNVALCREIRNYGVRRLARDTGFSERCIRVIISPKGNPRFRTFWKIAETMGMEWGVTVESHPASGDPR